MPSTVPLPLTSQPESVAVGKKTPVLPVSELAPASEFAPTTPEVSSVWFGAATSVNDLAKVSTAMPVPDQYTAWRLRTMPPAQVRRGSQIAWYLVNSAVPLTMVLPPTKTMRDQLKLEPFTVDVGAGRDLALMVWPLLYPSTAILVARSVFSALASRTAPSTFSMPAPCCNRLAP